MISKLENYYRKAIFLFKFLTNSSKLDEKIFDNIQYKNLVSVNSNLLLKLIFPREFSSQKKKKKFGNRRKTSFPRRSISILPDGSPRAFELVQSLSNPPRHCSFDFDPVNGARNFKPFGASTRFIYLLSSTSGRNFRVTSVKCTPLPLPSSLCLSIKTPL